MTRANDWGCGNLGKEIELRLGSENVGFYDRETRCSGIRNIRGHMVDILGSEITEWKEGRSRTVRPDKEI